jgi:hypothetical protein
MLYGKPSENFSELINFKELIKRHPNVTFPKNPTNESLESIGYVCVKPVENQVVQLHSTYLVEFDVELNSDGDYVRVPRQVSVTDEEAEIRRTRKWAEIRKKRNELLAKTDWIEACPYSYMQNEWKEYRQELRDITDTDLDPFEVVLTLGPRDYAEDTSLDGQKKRLKALAKMRRDKRLAERPRIDTGLGFYVDGSLQDITNLKMAKDAGETTIWDADGNSVDVTPEQFTAVIDIVVNNWQTIMAEKRTFDADIDAASEDQLATIENEINT